MKRIDPNSLVATTSRERHKRTRSYSTDEIFDTKRAKYAAFGSQLEEEEEEPEIEHYSESEADELSDFEEQLDKSINDSRGYHSYKSHPLASRAQASELGSYHSVGLRGTSEVTRGFDREPTVDPPETFLTAPDSPRIFPEETYEYYTSSELDSEDERASPDGELGSEDERASSDGELDSENERANPNGEPTNLTLRPASWPASVPRATNEADVRRVQPSLEDAQVNEVKQVAQRGDERGATNETLPVMNRPVEMPMDRIRDWVQNVDSEPIIQTGEDWPCLYKGCLHKRFKSRNTRNRRRHMDRIHLELHLMTCPVPECKTKPISGSHLKSHMRTRHTDDERDACNWQTYNVPKDPKYDGWLEDLTTYPERYHVPEPDDPILLWVRDHKVIKPGDKLWEILQFTEDANPHTAGNGSQLG
ncbi:hypothetical protein PHLGIDRAFT_34500, partial [Phlebiopsis gigantea 11061_1 CR5-6]